MMNNNSSLEKQLRTLRKRSVFTLFLTWMALFFTVVGIAAGYKNFLRVHDKAKVAQEKALSVAALAPSFASKDVLDLWQQGVIKQLSETSANSALELDEIKSLKESNLFITEALEKQMKQLTLQQSSQQLAAAPSQQWKANEARYLLQVASRKLQLDQDVTAAAQALFLADQALAEAAMPSLLAVRTQIAKDIALLNRYQPVMLEDVVLEIGRLSKYLKPKEVNITADETPRTLLKVTETDGRNSVINRVKDTINKAVVVRTYDENLAKKITGDTEGVRYALLQLKLEGLKLLALKQQQAAYDLQLAQIVEQLQNDSEKPVTFSMKKSLDVLSSFKLITAVPPILSVDLLNSTLLEKSEATK
jgi:uncharacterized protein HemX